MVKGFFILLLFQCAGEAVSHFFLPLIPGPVIGMILLLIMLMLTRQVQQVDGAAGALIQNLALFFMPAGVGLACEYEKFARNGWAIFLAITVGTILAFILLLFVARFFEGAK